MSSLHIHRGSQVVICKKVAINKHDNGVTISYRLPATTSETFLKTNSLYINVDGPNIINRVALHSFKGLSKELLEDGSNFLYSNSGIPFFYDNLVTVELNKRRHNNDTVHILLDPSKDERLIIKDSINSKIYWNNIVSRIEKTLVVFLFFFLLCGLLFLFYYFKDAFFPIFKITNRLPF